MRGRRRILGVALAVASAVMGAAHGQPPAPGAAAARPAPLVVRLGVDLVQVDAVVLDKKDRHVTDLEAADFVVLQDGKPREITHCEYVVAAPELAPAPVPESASVPGAPPASFTALRREDVRRVMAFVVDDYNLSADGIHRVTDGLGKIVREDVGPGDLVAIMRTSGGMGIFHQFTNDRRILEAAVRDLRERMPGMGFGEDAVVTGGNQWRDAWFANASLMAVKQVLEALRTLPGRKSVVLFSERLQVLQTNVGDDFQPLDEEEGRMQQAVREVTDLANRSSTVLYTVDPRGPNADIGLGAADPRANSDVAAGPDWQERLNQRRQERVASQTGMAQLAHETGGLFLSMVNHVDRAVRDIKEDQKGYYVLGYVPDEATFVSEATGPRFRKLEVKVKRPDLKVRSRTGFAGVPDTPVSATPLEGPRQALLQALVSPFAANTLPIRITPVFGHHPRDGYVLRAYVHLDAASVVFGGEAAAQRQAKLELVSAVFGEKGRMLPPLNRDVTLNVAPEKLAGVQHTGVVLELDVPVPKPGSYQLRVALRDTASGHLGSAAQFVPVPDLRQRRLALSGVVLGTVTARARQTGPADVTVSAATRMSPALRRFAPGADVSYGFAVYHPQVDKATGKPQLSSRVRLVRHGRAVLELDLSAVQVMSRLDLPEGKDAKPVPGFLVAGTFALPKDLEPGEYAVQVAVVDGAVEKEDRKTAGQWTSLEIAAP